MYTHVENTKESTSKISLNSVSRIKKDPEQGFVFVDNRKDVVSLRKNQKMNNIHSNMTSYSMNNLNVNSHLEQVSQFAADPLKKSIHSAFNQKQGISFASWHLTLQRQERAKDSMSMRKREIELNKSVLPGNGSELSPLQMVENPDMDQQVSMNHCKVIQLIGNRTVTSPTDSRPGYRSEYWIGWLGDVLDLISHGHLYDGIKLILSLSGSSSILPKVEELIRYLQHHPELIPNAVTSSLTALAMSYGVPPWIVILIAHVLSRGMTADSLGIFLLSYVPGASLIPSFLLHGLGRRLGTSLLNRGLIAAHGLGSSIHNIGGSLVSGVSRWLHGYKITRGAKPAYGDSMDAAGDEFGMLYKLIKEHFPIERLHIIPSRKGGKIKTDNATYGSAAANSLMIPLESADHPATAIMSPTGMLEGMGMRSGLFWARGIRGREGFLEHKIAKYRHMA